MVLVLAFLCLISIKVIELVDERTSTGWEVKHDGKVNVPSLTICPANPMKTLSKVQSMQMNDSELFYIKSSSLEVYVQHRVHQVFEDLKWTKTFHIQAYEQENMYPCFTLDPPIKHLEAPNSASFYLDIDKGIFEEFFLELHEKGHSTVNQLKSWDNIVWFGRKGFFLMVKMRETNRIRTRNHDCNEKGDSNPSNCLNEFYMEELGCSFPWLENHHLARCNNHSDMEKLYELSIDVSDRVEKVWDEVKNRNCMKENCKKIKWMTVDVTKDGPDPDYFEIAIWAENYEEVFENKLYGLTNFISDFGGYLGLLLGYSILSFFVWMVTKLKAKFGN